MQSGNNKSPSSKPKIWQSRLLRDSGVLFGIRIAAAGTVYLTQLVLARWLGPTELGIYVYATAWLWILAHLSGLGLPQAAQRFLPRYLVNQDFESCRGFMKFGMAMTLAAGTLVALLFMIAVKLFVDGDALALGFPLLLAALIIPLISINSVNAGIARANFWFYFSSLTNQFLRPALLLLFIAISIVIGLPAEAKTVLVVLLIVATIVTISQGIVLRARLRKTYPAASPRYHPSVWLLTALPIMLAELVISFFFDVQIIFARLYLSLHDLAVFNISLRTIAIMAFAVTAVGLATAPRAARLFEQQRYSDLQSLLRLATRATFLPSLFACLLFVLAGEYLLALFGPAFTAGYRTLVIASVAQLAIAYAGPIVPLLNVTGFQDKCLPPFVVSLALTPLLYWLLMPRLGMEGGAVAFLILAVMLTIWLRLLLKRHLNLKAGLF